MNEENQKILEDFTHSLTNLEEILTKVPEEGLDWSEKEGEWTIRQILHHMADDGNVYVFIIERALVTPGCKVIFGEFPGNESWADSLAFDQRPVKIAKNLILTQHQFLAELVGHLIDRWENKVGFYNEAGEKLVEQSVAQMICMLTEHMQEHAQTIKNVLAIKTRQ